MGYRNRLKQAYRRIFQFMVAFLLIGTTAVQLALPVKALSGNNLLDDVSFSKGTLNYEFSPSRIYYKLKLPADTTEVDVKVTPQDSSATYTVAGHTNINHSSSTGKIVVTVTAANGQKKWYTFAIEFEGGTATTKTTSKTTTTAKLSELQEISFDIGVLDVPFDPAVKTYILKLPKDAKQVKVSTIPSEISKLAVTGNDPLDPDNPEIVVSTARETYRFKVVFEDAGTSVPTDTTNTAGFGLEHLEVKDHSLNKTFKTNVYEYQMTVTDTAQKFEVLAVATDPEAMIEIDQDYSRLKIVVSTDEKRATYVICLIQKAQASKSEIMTGLLQDLLIAVVLLILAIALFILSRRIRKERISQQDFDDIDDE